jgi:signal transduction histidine kinase
VSAVSLAVAALPLLTALDRRLREDALMSLEEAGRTSRIEFAELREKDLRPGSPRLMRIVRAVGSHTGAEVAVVAPDGRVLASRSDTAAERFPDAALAARRNHAVSAIVGGASEAEARVALPVDAKGGRVGLALRRSLEASASAATIVRRELLIAAIVGFVSATLVGVLLARRLVRRLNSLRDRALVLAELGPGAEVREDATRDEVGDLTRAFAVMQRQLREQEQARRTFVATASHELRTPVASLRLMLGLLEEDLQSESPDLADARDQVSRADAQSERLGSLAGALLDLSRLDAGVPLRSEAVRLDENARAVVAEFEPRARAAGAELRLAAPDPVEALADPGSVAQVLRILLDNALRFSPPGAAVEVSVEAAGDATRIAVRDRGPGVPAEERERVFERFWRGGYGEEQSGFGLGLPIGRELARRLGGDLRLEASDGGACFVLVLPAAAVQSGAPVNR